MLPPFDMDARKPNSDACHRRAGYALALSCSSKEPPSWAPSQTRSARAPPKPERCLTFLSGLEVGYHPPYESVNEPSG